MPQYILEKHFEDGTVKREPYETGEAEHAVGDSLALGDGQWQVVDLEDDLVVIELLP
jgi:hypothetical protein